jgi:hypothetical protein
MVFSNDFKTYKTSNWWKARYGMTHQRLLTYKTPTLLQICKDCFGSIDVEKDFKEEYFSL